MNESIVQRNGATAHHNIFLGTALVIRTLAYDAFSVTLTVLYSGILFILDAFHWQAIEIVKFVPAAWERCL